jgi:hypothetical protein
MKVNGSGSYMVIEIIFMMKITTVGPAHQRHLDVSHVKVLIFEELLISIRDSTMTLGLPIVTLHNTISS